MTRVQRSLCARVTRMAGRDIQGPRLTSLLAGRNENARQLWLDPLVLHPDVYAVDDQDTEDILRNGHPELVR